jgi:hypothetical protein
MLVGRVIGIRSPSLRHAGQRLGVLATYSIVAGALSLFLAQNVMGVVSGNYLALAALGALMVFTVGCFTSVLQSLFGPAGTMAAVALLVLFGNPAGGSGQLAPEMLPTFWRYPSYFLPNPAAMRAFHGVESFSGRGIGTDMTVLAVHGAASIALMLVMLSRGLEAMSISKVAARAGVSKPTVYLRWSNSIELVVDAFVRLHPFDRDEPEDPGDKDLASRITQMIRELAESSLGRALPAIFAALARIRSWTPSSASTHSSPGGRRSEGFSSTPYATAGSRPTSTSRSPSTW